MNSIPTDKDSIELLFNVKSKNITTAHSIPYTILNYFDTISFHHDKKKRFYNSVVIDPETRKILSIGSPISYDFELFQKTYPVVDENIVAEEMVEGVSIQLFYDPRIKNWEISTRNSVAGNYSYYRLPGQSCKTYRDMLFDAMGLIGTDRQIEQWVGFKHLLASNCYHFIVKHPENHIVLKSITPQLFYIGYYELHCNTVNDVRYNSYHKGIPFPEGIVKTPRRIDLPRKSSNYKDFVDHYMHPGNEIKMGMSFSEINTGERCFILTPEYKTLQQIRGTHPNLLYQYLCLQRVGKINAFLKNFPQYKILFSTFRYMYDNLIRDIHQSYLYYYIKKSNPVVDKSIYFHIHQIHETIYKPSLNDAEKTIIKKEVVRKYVDALEPGCALHLLQRERYKDENLVKND
jgi:hypothetical protein